MDVQREAEFLRLFVAHEPALRAFLRTLLPSWGAVDDVLQEASVVMWKKLDQLDDEEGFLPWAKVIVRFKAMHARRTVARDRLVLSEETVALLADEAFELPQDQVVRGRKALDTCLKKLSVEYQKLVLLPYCEPGGVTELAERTKRSSNSLYKLPGRLREKLRLCVEQQDIFIVQGLVEQANGFRIQLDERCIERTCRHHALDESTVERLRGNNKQRQIIMKRTRSILCPFLLTILVSAPFADAEEKPGGDPPNMVFILADDLGFGDLSLDGIYFDGSKGYDPEK